MITLNNKNNGFTLIEVLVALSIAIIVIFSAYSLYFSLSKGTRSVYESIKNREKAYNILSLIRKELESIYYYPDVDYTGFKLEENDFYGKPASKITFTSFFKEGVKVVSYYVIEDKGILCLVKTTQDYINEEKPVKFVFLNDIGGFSVRILDEEFDKVYDTNKLHKLPKTLKVTLILKEGEETREYSDICEIMTAQ